MVRKFDFVNLPFNIEAMMKSKKGFYHFIFFVIPFLIFTSLISTAQTIELSKKLESQYIYGKELINKKQYSQAKEVFHQLITKSSSNDEKCFFEYMKAVSSFKAGDLKNALSDLTSLTNKGVIWDGVNDAKLLLSQVYFEKNLPRLALKSLTEVSSERKQDSNRILYQYLITKKTEEIIPLLSSSFLTEEVKKIISLKTQRLSQEEVGELKKEFGKTLSFLKENENNSISTYKNEYNVAVLLPLFLEDSTDIFHSKKWFPNTLYQGIKIALETLNEEDGSKFNLHVFDTKKEGTHVKKILQDTSFQHVDLILGPLYTKTLSPVLEYSRKNKIPVINPISSNPKIIEKNANAFLTAPSYKTIGTKLADYVHQQNIDTASAFIIYGSSPKEIQVAKAYKEKIESNGGHVFAYEPFDYSEDGFESLLATLDTIKTDSLGIVHYHGHVFASVTEEIPSVNILSALQSLQVQDPIIVPEEWLSHSLISFEQLEQEGLLVFAPHFVDYNKKTTNQFITRYIEAFGENPNHYAFCGFEALYQFGRWIKEYGSGFTNYIQNNEDLISSEVYSFYNYKDANDNQFVPIVKFIDTAPVIINSPLYQPDSLKIEEEEKLLDD